MSDTMSGYLSEELNKSHQEIEILKAKIEDLQLEINSLQRDLQRAERESYYEGYYNGRHEEKRGYPELIKNIRGWQDRQKQCPIVWVVEDCDGVVLSIYDCKEAAQLEADWHKIKYKGYTSCKVRKEYIQTLDLARERFNESS